MLDFGEIIAWNINNVDVQEAMNRNEVVWRRPSNRRVWINPTEANAYDGLDVPAQDFTGYSKVLIIVSRGHAEDFPMPSDEHIGGDITLTGGDANILNHKSTNAFIDMLGYPYTPSYIKLWDVNQSNPVINGHIYGSGYNSQGSYGVIPARWLQIEYYYW